MLIYNKLYKNNRNAWGKKFNPLIKRALRYVKPKSKGLDLGCGQGKDTFYLSIKGFNMTAVDSSEIAIKQIKDKISTQHIKNIKAKQADVSNYVIKKDKFNFIICLNLLQFLDKKSVKKVISEIKNKLAKDGIIIISAFTDKDSSFRSKKKNLKHHFKKNELLSMFKDFKCLYYFEDIIKDSGHAGKEDPHEHGIVDIIAKKY